MRAFKALFVTIAVLNVTPALAQGVTKTEIRAQSKEATARQLRDQIWGMFEVPDLRRKTTPRVMLDGVSLSTPAYPSSVPGVCRRDSVTVAFVPVDPGERKTDADTPVRARGIEVAHMYHRVSPAPAKWETGKGNWYHVAGRAACVGLKDETSFEAKNDDDADISLRLTDAVIAAFRTGGVVPDCGRMQLPAGQTCAEVARALDAGALVWVAPCDPPGDGLTCTLFNIGGQNMEVHWRDRTAKAPIEIVQATLYYDIVVADSRID